MCAPAAVAAIGIATSVISTGLGIYGAVAQSNAATAQAEYNFQVQQAQSNFQFAEANRQMDYQFQEQLRQSQYVFDQQMAARDFEYRQQLLQFDAAQAEQQRRFQYESAVAQQQFEFQQLQVDLNRGFEQMREDQQRSVMEMNRDMAGAAFANDLRQLDIMFMQEEEAAAQQKQKAARDAAQQRAAIRASGRQGNTVENLVADYYRQQAQYDFAVGRNLAFTGMATQERKRGAQAQYGARLASEQPYIQTPYADPVRALVPQPGAGARPLQGPMPIRQQVTRGTVAQSPVYKSFVSTTPYMIQGVSTAMGGIMDTAGYAMQYRNATQPGRSN